MTEQYGATPEQRELKEREVADYLHRHPDFFARHEYLLEEMEVRHPDTGKAVSLIERQVSVMREQKQQLRQQLHQLTQAAKANETLLQRFQVLILNLIDSDNLDQAVAYIREALQEDFHADAVELVLIDCLPRAESVAADDARLKPFQRIMQAHYPVCGHFSLEQMQLLFGQRGDEIASAVVVPLCEGEREPCLGLLGIGSVDPKRYHPDMGTVFVSHLGAVMNRIFNAHLDR
ncbi:MAG: DUF484 family protein [Pseudomonadota bacterium]